MKGSSSFLYVGASEVSRSQVAYSDVIPRTVEEAFDILKDSRPIMKIFRRIC